MKLTMYLLLFLAVANPSFGQGYFDTTIRGKDTIIIETPTTHFKSNVKYIRLDSIAKPQVDVNQYIHSKLINLSSQDKGKTIRIGVLVKSNGKIEDVTLLDKVDNRLKRNIISIVQKMPPWRPAYLNGKAVDNYQTFSLKL